MLSVPSSSFLVSVIYRPASRSLSIPVLEYSPEEMRKILPHAKIGTLKTFSAGGIQNEVTVESHNVIDTRDNFARISCCRFAEMAKKAAPLRSLRALKLLGSFFQHSKFFRMCHRTTERLETYHFSYRPQSCPFSHHATLPSCEAIKKS